MQSEGVGFIQGLEAEFNTPVSYSIKLENTSIRVSVGNHVRLQYANEKACVHCGRRVRKLYQNGYCFPCTQTLAECDLCIVKPHECHFHLGTCRDEAWAQDHCMIPHYVYLAVSSSVKVGLTRRGRELIRWMEQGAEQAMAIAELPSRKLAGELEMEIAKNIPDKTNWRKMLTRNGERMNLNIVREQVLSSLPEKWSAYVIRDVTSEHCFVFPRESEFVPKLSVISLDKEPSFEGVVRGLKGQYLLFDEGVLNIRKYIGYKLQVSVS